MPLIKACTALDMVYIAKIKLNIKKLKLLFSIADLVRADIILKTLLGRNLPNTNMYLLSLITGVYTTALMLNIKKGNIDNNK